MKQELIERLSKNEIQLNDILSEVELNSNCIVVIYTSHLNGLGSDESDFDVYVVFEDSNQMSTISRKVAVVIKGIEIDIEYYVINEISEFLESNRTDIGATNFLSFLLRLMTGEIIYNSFSNIVNFQKLVDVDRMEKMGIETFWLSSLGIYDDALKMYNQSDYVSGIVLARNALNYITMAINIINKDYVFKQKWAYRLLKRTLGEDHEYVKKYLKFTLGEVSDPARTLEELLFYIQTLTTKVRLWDGTSKI